MFKKNDSQYRKYNTLHNLTLMKICTAPEARFTPQGKKVCSFSTVFTECYGQFPDSQMFQESWVKVTGWEKQAEAMEKLAKGDWILVETVVPGLNTWTTAEGVEKAGLAMTMKGFPRKVSLVASGAVSEAAHDGNGQQNDTEAPPEDEQDIPF